MRLADLCALALALTLVGCAAAMPGYVPPSERRDKMLAAAPKGGGFDDSGTYKLTEQEQKLDCKHLNGGITVKILQMRDAANRAKPSAVATTAQQVARPFKGGTTYGVDLGKDYQADRARLEALNKQLADKACRTFDLDAELKPGNTATPSPVGEAAKAAKKK